MLKWGYGLRGCTVCRVAAIGNCGCFRRCGSRNGRSDSRSRSRGHFPGSSHQTFTFRSEIYTVRALIIRRSELQECNRFLDKPLRREELCVLQIPIIQTRQLERLRTHIPTIVLLKICIIVLRRSPEHRHLLHKRLQCMRMRRIMRCIHMRLIYKGLLLLCQLIDPDIYQPLQSCRRQIRQRCILPVFAGPALHTRII